MKGLHGSFYSILQYVYLWIPLKFLPTSQTWAISHHLSCGLKFPSTINCAWYLPDLIAWYLPDLFSPSSVLAIYCPLQFGRKSWTSVWRHSPAEISRVLKIWYQCFWLSVPLEHWPLHPAAEWSRDSLTTESKAPRISQLYSTECWWWKGIPTHLDIMQGKIHAQN